MPIIFFSVVEICWVTKHALVINGCTSNSAWELKFICEYLQSKIINNEKKKSLLHQILMTATNLKREEKTQVEMTVR